MAGPVDWNHGLMLLLLTATCAPLTTSDTTACPSEILENTTVDIEPAITNGATGRDPVHVSTEAKCLEKCCLANTASEDWNCTLVIFDSRKTGNHPNCYLFHCPTNDACPTKTSTGVTSHRLMRDEASPGNSHSKAKDSKPTYVEGNKKNGLLLDLRRPEPNNQDDPLATGSSMNKSITSKILDLAEDIVNHLDKIDHSLQEKNGNKEEKKEDSKPSSYQKPGLIVQLATTGAAAANIMTTTQATTSTTTLTTTATTLQMTTTILSTTTTIPTTTLMATTPRPTLPPKPQTTPKPTTTTTPLPSTTAKRLPTTTTLPTTTSTVTTTLPITTHKITSLPTTTSTTTRLATTSTTTTEPPLRMARTTTPFETTNHPFVKLRPANSHLSKTASSKVISLTSTAESRVPAPDVRPQAPLPKTRNSTSEGASKINVSAPKTPFVGAESVTSSQNFNHGLNGYEKKMTEDLPNPDSKSGDRSGLLAALVFGVVFFAVVVFLITRRAVEAMRRRHYSRLDYLINGMYVDS